MSYPQSRLMLMLAVGLRWEGEQSFAGTIPGDEVAPQAAVAVGS